jgi:hypothetical protein
MSAGSLTYFSPVARGTIVEALRVGYNEIRLDTLPTKKQGSYRSRPAMKPLLQARPS